MKTQFLFVHSGNTDREYGENHTVSFDLPEDVLRCTDAEYLNVTLVQFSIINNIRNIKHDDFIIIGDSKHTIPAGTYTVREYVEKFNEFDSTVQATFDRATRTITFTNSGDTGITVDFSENLRALFGVSAPIATTVGNEIVSREINPQPVTELVVSADRVMPGPPRNATNFGQAELAVTDIIGIIPMVSAPGTMNVWTNTNHSFEMMIYDTDVQRLGLRITDYRRRPIVSLPDWSCTLRVSIEPKPKQDPVASKLDAVLKYMSLFTLMNYVSSQPPEQQQQQPLYGPVDTGEFPDWFPGRHNFM